jgi:hypothetical protein
MKKVLRTRVAAARATAASSADSISWSAGWVSWRASAAVLPADTGVGLGGSDGSRARYRSGSNSTT